MFVRWRDTRRIVEHRLINNMAKLTWTIELGIEDTWIADGFDLKTEDDIEALKEAIQHRLPWAYGHEISLRVLRAPADEKVKKLQGFE